MKVEYPTNEYQTPITKKLLDSLPEELVSEFWDYINNVPFIQRLISPDRPYAKDLDKDEEGKIIIDLSNPHILEDMDYFRETAIHYQKHGVYTKLRVNTHPMSEYMRWFKQELDRCWYGMVRPSDGEWITGDMYFYLNYFPIIQTRIVTKGKARYGERTVDFPETWEGVYWRFHYWEQAKKGGMHNEFIGNQHAVEIARRGAAHPYSQKVLTPEGYKLWGDIQVGDLLYGTNNDITKVVDIPFDDEDDIYTITLYDGRKIQSSLNHLWNVYKHSGSNRDVIYTMPLKDILKDYRRTRKISDRNPKGVEYIYSIPKNEGIEIPERTTKIDPYTFGLLLGDGTFAGNWTSRVGFSSRKSDMEVYKRYIPYDTVKWGSKNYYGIIIDNVKSILQEYNLYHKRSEFKFIPEEFKHNSRKVRMEILQGLMDTDGSVDRRGIPYIGSSSKRLIEDIQWICRSLGYNCSYTKNKAGYKKANGVYKECLPSYILRIFTNDPIFKLERKIRKLSKLESNYSKSKVIKTRIINIEYSHREKCKCVTVDSKDNSYLIGDFVQTHNSKSYSVGSKVLKNFVLGIDQLTTEKVKALVVAYNKEYLIKDGTLNKVVDGMNFLSKSTEFPSRRSKSSMSDMHWVMGWTDTDGNERGSQNEVLGVSISDDPDKIRGKRSNIVIYEEYAAFSKFLDTWQVGLPNVQEGSIAFGQNIGIACVCENTKVWNGKDIVNVQDLEDTVLGYTGDSISQEPITYKAPEVYKECVRIEMQGGKYLECSVDHPLLTNYTKRLDRYGKVTFTEAGDLKKGDRLIIPLEEHSFGNKEMWHPRMVGLLIGDGGYGKGSTALDISINNDSIYDYINDTFDITLRSVKECTDGSMYSRAFIKGEMSEFKKLGIYGQAGDRKRLPDNIYTYRKEDIYELLGGLFDADGNVQIMKNTIRIKLTAKNRELLDQVHYLLLSLGIYSSIYEEAKRGSRLVSKVNNKTYDMPEYTCNVLYITHIQALKKFRESIKFLDKEKQARLELVDAISISRNIGHFSGLQYEHTSDKGSYFIDKHFDNVYATIINEVIPIGERRVYNLTADTTHTYMTNGVLSHNTGGSEGADFAGALEMIQHPKGYNVYALPNVYDKGSSGQRETLFFFPGYVNVKGFYDKDGVSDVVGAMLDEMKFRHTLKYNSSDPLQLSRRKAETAFTIQDAIMKTDSTIYPVADLHDQINKIDGDPSLISGMYVGRLELDNGEVVWQPDADLRPIMNYPHKDNRVRGAVYIKEHPIKDSNGKIPWGRYISGADTVDTDGAETLSLFSGYVLDLWTDEIVAEYTGREDMVNDSFEIYRRLLVYYNALGNYENNKKGLFAHFSRYNSLHHLSDSLDYLRERDPQRQSWGNAAKGTPASKPIQSQGRIMLREFLLKPVENIIVEVEEGEEVERTVTEPNLRRIHFRALLQELASYNQDSNFDRHDAMIMLMLLREDFLRRAGDDSLENRYKDYDKDYLGEDDFFTNNYPGDPRDINAGMKEIERLGLVK